MCYKFVSVDDNTNHTNSMLRRNDTQRLAHEYEEVLVDVI
jgi:hypothetical protein